MATNNAYSVRFYIRATKTKCGDNEPRPLRVRVWIAAKKRQVYLSTTTPITPNQLKHFAPDGTPLTGADPKLIKVIDRLRAAIGLVLNILALNGTLAELSSADFARYVVGVLYMMAESEPPVTPLFGVNPNAVALCADCVFKGVICRAPWPYIHYYVDEYGDKKGSETIERADTAADFAAFRNVCFMRVVKESDRFFYSPSPIINGEIRPIVQSEPDRANVIRALETAYLLQQEKGGDK